MKTEESWVSLSWSYSCHRVNRKVLIKLNKSEELPWSLHGQSTSGYFFQSIPSQNSKLGHFISEYSLQDVNIYIIVWRKRNIQERSLTAPLISSHRLTCLQITKGNCLLTAARIFRFISGSVLYHRYATLENMYHIEIIKLVTNVEKICSGLFIPFPRNFHTGITYLVWTTLYIQTQSLSKCIPVFLRTILSAWSLFLSLKALNKNCSRRHFNFYIFIFR